MAVSFKVTPETPKNRHIQKEEEPKPKLNWSPRKPDEDLSEQAEAYLDTVEPADQIDFKCNLCDLDPYLITAVRAGGKPHFRVACSCCMMSGPEASSPLSAIRIARKFFKLIL